MKRHERGSIPFIEHYRGIGIHDSQSRERIDRVVKPAIDAVFNAVRDVPWLSACCRDASKPPEARILAGAVLKTIHQSAADQRVARPEIDIAMVNAWVAGLDGECWRSTTHFGLAFDPEGPGEGRAVKRETELED
jgi:hypothetical protein